MKVELDEKEMQEYADRRMKQKIDQRVDQRMKEIDWYKSVDHAVQDAVDRHITESRIAAILCEIDRKELIERIAKHLAEDICDKLIPPY